MTDLKHISEGNSKTECFSFDIPARDTCPGKTIECAKDCYAYRLMRIYPSVGRKYDRNETFAKANAADFFLHMVNEIPRDCQFRIHVSGDFFSPSYVKRWVAIAKARPDVTFYAYTRSWRIPAIWNAIRKLHALPNVNVNLSVDDETGAPHTKLMKALRWCYLTKTDNVPSWIRLADIVFRSNHVGHKKRRKNAIAKGTTPPPLVKRLTGIVCPLEQGQDIPKFSCAKCRLCVDKPSEVAYV